MAISFFSAKEFTKPLKVTIQKTGRLGFTEQTAKAMQLNDKTYFKFGKDDELAVDLIMVKTKEENEESFRAIKSGNYFYLATAALFDHLNYKYEKETIIFDVKREATLDQEAGGEVYLLTRRGAKTRRAAAKTEPAADKVEPVADKVEPSLNFGE